MSTSLGKKSSDLDSVFDRLYRTETVSSSYKRASTRHIYHSPIHKGASARANRAPRSNKIPFALVDRNKERSGRNKGTLKKGAEKAPDFRTPPMSPAAEEVPRSSSPKRTRLRCSSKYRPEEGFSDLSPASLDVVEILSQYENGDTSPQKMAMAIIDGLFTRDFEDGTRWVTAPATVIPLKGENVFAVEKQANMELRDIISVAKAMGTIRFLPDKHEIHIENYSYNVAG